MIILAWAIFWLTFYTGTDVSAYTIVDGRVDKYDGSTNHASRIITIDIDKINSYPNWGSWDRIVMTSCLIAHETVHADGNYSEREAYGKQLECLDRMPWVDKRIVDNVKGYLK